MDAFLQDYMNPETVNQLTDYVLNGVAFVLILAVGRWVAARIRTAIRSGLDRPNLDQTLVKFAGNFAYYAIFILAAFMGLQTLGVETASFVAVLAAAGFAIGLALQGTLANFAAGILLLVFRPFNVGDYIEAAGETGYVRDLQLFYTKVDTLSNQRVIIPNGDLFGSTIRNIFHHEHVRVECAVGTDYPADIDDTRQVLLEAARSVDDRVEAKGVQAALIELGGSSINWEVRVWATSENYFRLRQDLTRAVKYHLDEAGIGIPYPQMDVHLDTLNDDA